MLSWLRRRRETAERIDAEADALISELGVEAYAEARRREYESSGDAIALRWNRVALAVAHKTDERIGLDTSTRLAMNTIFAPDRGHPENRNPQPFSRANEQKGTSGPTAIPAPVYQLGAGSRTFNCDRTRDSSFGCRPQSSPLRRSQCRPERSDCASSTVKTARSLVDGGASAQGSTNDRENLRGVSPRLFLGQGCRPTAASSQPQHRLRL